MVADAGMADLPIVGRWLSGSRIVPKNGTVEHLMNI
jgi:hypothetical protein